jgi:hypothetical protein
MFHVGPAVETDAAEAAINNASAMLLIFLTSFLLIGFSKQ